MWGNYSRSIFTNKWNNFIISFISKDRSRIIFSHLKMLARFKIRSTADFFSLIFFGNNGFTPSIVYWTETEKMKIIYYLGHQRFASPCRQQKKAQAGLHDDDDSVPKINAIQNCVNFSHRAQNETKVLCRLGSCS